MTTRHEQARQVLAEAERRAADASSRRAPTSRSGGRGNAEADRPVPAGAHDADTAAPSPGAAGLDARGDPEAPDDDGCPDDVIRRIVLDRLALRDHTRAQLEEVLRRKGAAAPAVARVLDRMSSAGLINDDAYATAFVATRQRGRGWGRARLANELRVRGVDPQITQSALAAITPGVEREQAEQLAMRRLPQLRGLPTETARRRLAGLLARRGYPAEVVYDAVAAALVARDQSDQA